MEEIKEISYGGKMNALCYENPYLREFDAKIARIKKEGNNFLISLDKTYFFYGSGGQSCDAGEIIGGNGKAIVDEVFEADGEIIHKARITGNLYEGENVRCKIDWERRYKLMKAHTTEHLLFQCLKRKFGKIYVEKIRISPEKFSFFISFDKVDWDKILEAEKLANDIIREGKDVLVKEIDINEARSYGDNLRIKFDRIGSDRIRVVEIKDFDLAACTGLHIKNTKEIEFVLIDKITSEKGLYEVEFLIGREAVEKALELSKIALSLSSILQTDFSTIEKFAEKLRKDYLELQKKFQEISKKSLEEIKYEEIAGIKLYKQVFEKIDNKTLMEKVGKIIKESKTVVIFANLNEKASIILARSDDLKLNVRDLLNEALRLMNGRGGGRENFATGAGDKEKVDEAMDFLDRSIKNWIKGIKI
ncbi:MAG: DHHA1 domain-containing protein [Candidatus Parvarchaeota archaeon]|nr:DHHA1 domain-containing protein [Candidatus Jingweiarchaeum tengchongense]MCW1298523.1 DHHA1 domain-containing protein [Candidatus Jingweiarchaeum tengchongense]MCW1300231.1 DHHA1 domain-containing protein [Candidatus Jingweiarchaeum tengchongense]MCW1304535.1 DHHA1 domain-containing protein [Candidatus Jingweiarchaeum tengchongense]MCW1305737.1 DHHA1 domain-containing protein [Candidatus Jingweiarchaeum tengchongense]